MSYRVNLDLSLMDCSNGLLVHTRRRLAGWVLYVLQSDDCAQSVQMVMEPAEHD